MVIYILDVLQYLPHTSTVQNNNININLLMTIFGTQDYLTEWNIT